MHTHTHASHTTVGAPCMASARHQARALSVCGQGPPGRPEAGRHHRLLRSALRAQGRRGRRGHRPDCSGRGSGSRQEEEEEEEAQQEAQEKERCGCCLGGCRRGRRGRRRRVNRLKECQDVPMVFSYGLESTMTNVEQARKRDDEDMNTGFPEAMTATDMSSACAIHTQRGPATVRLGNRPAPPKGSQLIESLLPEVGPTALATPKMRSLFPVGGLSSRF